MTKLDRHGEICDYIKDLYRKKNADYGDSFHLTYAEEGMAMPRIRLSDKFNRFKTLSRTYEHQLKLLEDAQLNGDTANPDAYRQVADESLADTLIDLANYAIMTVLEMEQSEGKFD